MVGCKKSVQFLKVFYDATVTLFDVYYPNSLLVLHNIIEITKMFFFFTRNDELSNPIVEVMEKKFKKYWSKILLLYSFVFILNPLIKLQGLCKCLAHIGASLDLDFITKCTNVNNKLFEVYAMYENKFDKLRNQ